jgi:hypothetical protein
MTEIEYVGAVATIVGGLRAPFNPREMDLIRHAATFGPPAMAAQWVWGHRIAVRDGVVATPNSGPCSMRNYMNLIAMRPHIVLGIRHDTEATRERVAARMRENVEHQTVAGIHIGNNLEVTPAWVAKALERLPTELESSQFHTAKSAWESARHFARHKERPAPAPPAFPSTERAAAAHITYLRGRIVGFDVGGPDMTVFAPLTKEFADSVRKGYDVPQGFASPMEFERYLARTRPIPSYGVIGTMLKTAGVPRAIISYRKARHLFDVVVDAPYMRTAEEVIDSHRCMGEMYVVGTFEEFALEITGDVPRHIGGWYAAFEQCTLVVKTPLEHMHYLALKIEPIARSYHVSTRYEVIR